MNDNASTPCPPWCAQHRVDIDDPSQVRERVETHNAETFSLRPAEDRPSFVALTLSAMVEDGDPWDPSIGLYTHPESPNTIPAGPKCPAGPDRRRGPAQVRRAGREPDDRALHR